MSRAIQPEILRQTLQGAAGEPTSVVRAWVRPGVSNTQNLPAVLEGGYVSARFFPMVVDPTAWVDWILSVDPFVVVNPAVPVAPPPLTGPTIPKRLVSGDPVVEFILPNASEYGAAAWILATYGSAEGWIEFVAT